MDRPRAAATAGQASISFSVTTSLKKGTWATFQTAFWAVFVPECGTIRAQERFAPRTANPFRRRDHHTPFRASWRAEGQRLTFIRSLDD